MISQDLLESSIQRIGGVLANQPTSGQPLIYQKRWWNELLLEWGMKDEEFKVQLFRFVDVLPTLRTDAQFTRILAEYFAETPLLARPLRWSLRKASASWLGSHVGALVLRRQFLRMARTFMVGESIRGALPVLSQLWEAGRASSIDLLGEATVSEKEADEYRDRCLEAIEVLHRHAEGWSSRPLLESDHLGPIPPVHLSIKVSALYSQLDPVDPQGSFHGVAKRLRPILDLAMKLPAGITFDMEQAEFKDLTFHIAMRILSEGSYQAFPHAGIALQAYLEDAETTLNTVIDWVMKRKTPFTIRLVKGAYWDSETVQYEQRGWPIPVLMNKAATDENYECLTRTILQQHRLIRPAFGTHNLRSLAHAEASAQAEDIPENGYEFQMLYGMAETLQEAVAAYKRRIRIYAPVGELIPGMAYLVRRLLENTSNESFIQKQHDTSVPLEVLLAPPHAQNGSRRMSDGETPSSVIPLGQTFSNEPHTDFSHDEARMALTKAIAQVKTQFGQTVTYPLPPGVTCAEEMVSRNPSNPQEVVARIPCIRAEDVELVVNAAQTAETKWRMMAPETRADILVDMAQLVRKQRQGLAAWEIFETGKPWREADADIAEAIDFLEFYAHEMRQLSQPQRLGQEPGELNHLSWVPRGLTVVISPWNFSLAIPTGLVSAALVTGNVVLFKPSERSPLMGYTLYSLFREAGLPEGALYYLPGGPPIGQALVAHPAVKTIAFTGSKDVGLHIIKQSAELAPGQGHVKHVIAEMGGKNAIIVDETADLDEAVTGVLASMIGYQGQKCSACSRVIVLSPIYEEFVHRLTQAAQSLHIGPPENPTNQMGPMIDQRALEKVREYVEIGRKEGRVLLDRRIEGEGWFQGPVILADIEPHHRVAQEEIFGPVLAILKTETFEKALHMAIQGPYALTGGIYSRSPANIQRARVEFDVGNFYINRTITGSLVSRQPFGGHRLSGVGMKAGGKGYLEQFMNQRVISENTLRRGFAPTV